jgi:hypothetical protein
MILVEAGAINVEDLVSALAEQRRTRRRLGEILIDSGRITWLQLAEAITEQARDLDPMAAPPPSPEPAPAPPATPEPGSSASLPPLGAGRNSAGRPAGRPDVEVMLMERQRAFLELVAVSETLRATVARLQDELAERDAEIARLRSSSLPLTG